MFRSARLLVILLFLAFPRGVLGGELTLAWDPPTDGVTTGYVIFVGTTPGSYSSQLWIGRTTTHVVGGLTPGATYYFVVRARDASGRLSGPSNMVKGTVKGGISSRGCLTPDPFAALGGGTCRNGGWLPPGMVPAPGAPPPPIPAAPALPPVPARPSVPPAPASPPAAPGVGCTTPDPFVILGGGTCRNGGWLPPGMAAPAPAPPAVAPPPPPSTPTVVPVAGPVHAPPVSDTSCSSDDPFRGIAGLVGVCRVGGWTPWPGLSTAATVRWPGSADYVVLDTDIAGAFAVFPDDTTAALLADGARVTVRALYEPASDDLPDGTRLLRIVELRAEP